MKNKTYTGLMMRAPAHLNPSANPYRFVFSGYSDEEKDANGDPLPFVAVLLAVEGGADTIPFLDFLADVNASRGGLPGTLTRLAPAFKMARFSYHRPKDGSAATADIKDAQPITRQQLRGATRTPPPPPRNGPSMGGRGF